jgi:tRNA modification GTPase
MREPSETIAAVATPNGRGGIGVVRVSGDAARRIASELCGVAPEPRHARLTVFAGAEGMPIDRGLALFFPAPHSFTGEDVLELHAHGNPVVLNALLQRVCELGARPARGGEFSERAFLNGKLDLVQAEAIADLIAARSEAQVHAALRSLDGGFSRRVDALCQTVIRLRVEVEAAIDFAEDAAESASQPALASLFAEAAGQLDTLLVTARQGVRLTDGLHAVIVGAPNVGKSSLLNALAGSERAIVTDIPGTTRDVLREAIVLDGIELTLADTAGLREAADVVEGEGIRRARAELARADLVLMVIENGEHDANKIQLDGVRPDATHIVIVNKIDIDGTAPWRRQVNGVTTIALSAHTGSGLGLLREELKHVVMGTEVESAVSARDRHVLALERAGSHLAAARAAMVNATPELMAEDLRALQQALGEITGTYTSEDLLGAIFSTFCVGK